MSQPPINPARPLDYGTERRKTSVARGAFGWVLFIGVAVILFFVVKRNAGQSVTIPLSSFRSMMGRGTIVLVTIDKDELYGRFAAPQTIGGITSNAFRCPLPAGTTGNWAFTEWLLERAQSTSTEVRVEPGNGPFTDIVLPLIPWVLIFGFIWFFVFRQLRGQNKPAAPVPVVVVSTQEGT